MNTTLAKINLYDSFNAWFVGLITPEIPRMNKLRDKNNLNPKVPTFEAPSTMPFEYVTIDGIRIRIAKNIVSEDKPTILLLSTFPHSILAYSPVWDILKSDFNIFAYDMPGFGASETDREYMTIDFQGNFLDSFVKHFDIQKPHIVAPDVAMPSAVHYFGTHQDRRGSLMIGDGPAIVPGSDSSVIKKMTGSYFWRTMFTIAGSGALVASGNNLCNINYVPNKYEISDFKNSYKKKVGNNMQRFKRYANDLPKIDAMLGKISVPTKVFWGEHDAILFSDDAKKTHEKIPNSELQVFENSGHFVYQDQYKKFAEMVRDFVNKNL